MRMKNLKKLFSNCAYDIKYETAGHDVNYAFIQEDNTLYIYFQGSSSWLDWVRNFLFTKKVYKEFRVHRGFYDAYEEVRNIILDKVYNIYNQELQIIIVGYSHGGALCTLCLEDLVYHFPLLDIKGYAFESPRSVKAPKKIRDRWKNLTLIRNGCDIVTHCPPKFLGYNDLGKTIKIKGDVSLVKNKLPCFIKYHYPECVYDGLKKMEGGKRA